MPFTVSVRSDWMKLHNQLSETELKQLPFATARALTQTAKQAQVNYKEAAPKIFDRPTVFTLNATYVRPAKKNDLVASIEIKDENAVSKGTPAAKFLAPEILGGGRRFKRFERRISRALGLPDTFMVPGHGAELDRYGNMSRGQIVKIISSLAGFVDTGQNVNSKGVNKGKRRTEKYFVANSKADGAPLGIWKVESSGKVVPVLIFLKRAPSYHSVLDFVGLMTKSFEQNFPPLMKASFEAALKTAK